MPIRILPPILANQIAAGDDAVERPSFVERKSGSRKNNNQE
ncbi:hypothetical protein ACW5XF_12780 [Aeromonas lusitana]|nr:hypothetical protein [Aeromonas lusitana]